MSEPNPADVAIVGGGVVGIATALCLQDAGMSVLLIDRDVPGAGCSSGNASVIASSFVLPLSSFAHILGAPKMLMDRMAPLSLPWRHVPNYAPWLWRFALNAFPAKRRHTIDRLIQLNEESLPAWKRLLPDTLYSQLFRERGMLDVVAADRPIDSLTANAEALRAEGVPIDLLDASQVAELEPLLKGKVAGATLHTAVTQITDPRHLSDMMMERFLERGGVSVQMEVAEVRSGPDEIEVIGGGQTRSARRAVISAGWWSPALIKRFNLRAPLRAERGYHVMLPAVSESFSRPVSFHHESFLATPLTGGLRLAGTVELAPPDAPPDWRRADNLLKLAGRYLPDIDTTNLSRWVGARPSFADSLPAIGRVNGAPNVFYSFGHQHLGLTQAAISAEYIRDIIRGTMPANIDSYSLVRFGGTAAERAA
ncbi:MAG: FAD-binding oxidoreductase [Sphingomonadales bacterium]|nr:FAD-binding oxidoreductase [Sphingomonadales bacterium]